MEDSASGELAGRTAPNNKTAGGARESHFLLGRALNARTNRIWEFDSINVLLRHWDYP